MTAAANDTCHVALTRTSCCECGIVFAPPSAFIAARQSDGKSFYCPNGHSLSWSGNSENDRLRRERDNLQKRLEWAQNDAARANVRAEAEERSARAIRGHATRLRKRIAEGKCPCCARVFADMAAHIAAKHPRYRPTEET